jgi:hypothetical protein
MPLSDSSGWMELSQWARTNYEINSGRSSSFPRRDPWRRLMSAYRAEADRREPIQSRGTVGRMHQDDIQALRAAMVAPSRARRPPTEIARKRCVKGDRARDHAGHRARCGSTLRPRGASGLPTGCRGQAYRTTPGWSLFLSRLRFVKATMDQKSSDPQAVSFVSQALKLDTFK